MCLPAHVDIVNKKKAHGILDNIMGLFVCLFVCS